MSGTDGVDTGINVDRSWRGLYAIGAVAALVALAGTFGDIVITMIPGWEISTVPASIEQWFDQFQTNTLLGLRNLDLLNVTVSVIGIPMYVALFGAHRKVSQGYAALALVVVVLGTAVFITNNVALPMLELSRQYATATTEAQRLALQGAAQALRDVERKGLRSPCFIHGHHRHRASDGLHRRLNFCTRIKWCPDGNRPTRRTLDDCMECDGRQEVV